MQRQFRSHAIDEVNRSLRVFSSDGPAQNGAHHDYLVEVPVHPDHGGGYAGYTLRFHNPDHYADGAVNGVSDEAVLTIVADRLQCQSLAADPTGKYKAAYASVVEALSRLGVQHSAGVDSRVDDHPSAQPIEHPATEQELQGAAEHHSV
jgi:hypothetical protein